MRLYDLIVEGYREVQDKFSQDQGPTQVKQTIAAFRDLVTRNQVSGNERNIDWWGKKSYGEFEKFVNAKSQQKSQTQIKKRKATGQSHTLDENDDWLIVVPLDKDSSCFHGKDTDWCTTKASQSHFESYFYNSKVTLIYFLQKKTGAKWAMAIEVAGAANYFDKQDRSLTRAEFDSQTGLDSNKYMTMVGGDTDAGKKVKTSRASMKEITSQIRNLLDQFSGAGRSAEIETLLFKTKDSNTVKQYVDVLYDANNEQPVLFDQPMQSLIASVEPPSLEYVDQLTPKTLRIMIQSDSDNIIYVKNPSKETLDLISKNSEYAYAYARDVLRGPFPAGEAAIATNPTYSSSYVQNVLKEPFPAGEAAIATDSYFAFHYARRILDGPFPAGEAAIAKTAQNAYRYARDIINQPFPAGEAAIATDPAHALDYANRILKGPFPAGEAAIATSPEHAYFYAAFVLRAPFPAGEAAIAKDAKSAISYATHVLKKPWPAGEASIATDPNHARRYQKTFGVEL